MQFYILMIDYGYKHPTQDGPRGMEAVCNPEFTRRQIVEEARDILASSDRSITFVKFVDGNYIEDVTAEICTEAGHPDAPLSPVNRQAARFDHARDLRKHEAA